MRQTVRREMERGRRCHESRLADARGMLGSSRLAWALGLVMVTLILGCGNDEDSGLARPALSVAPMAIRDLRVELVDDDRVELQWTAPGEDYDEGRVAHYDVRYSTSGADGWWSSANRAPYSGDPHIPGWSESMGIGRLDRGSTYRFAVKATDRDRWGGVLGEGEGRSAAKRRGRETSWYQRRRDVAGLVSHSRRRNERRVPDPCDPGTDLGDQRDVRDPRAAGGASRAAAQRWREVL